MKLKKTEKVKVGICIPPPVKKGQSASINFAGIGRIPLATHTELISLLRDYDDAKMYFDLNFRNSFIKNRKVYLDDFCLNDLDIFFWYCEIDRSVGSYDLEVLKTLALDTKVVVNPEGFEVGLDKYKSHLAIKRIGGSVAEMVLFNYNGLEHIERVLDEWGTAVLKPRRGGFGKGVTYIDSFPMLRDVIEYIQSTMGVSSNEKAYMLEKFYKNDISRWVSVTIIGGEIMYGYRKKKTKFIEMSNGVKKVYDANEIGGEVDYCEVPEAYKKEALKAYDAIGTEIIGFDMISDGGKPIIIDENTFPGYYDDIFKKAGRDSAKEFYKFIISEINKFNAASRC